MYYIEFLIMSIIFSIIILLNILNIIFEKFQFILKYLLEKWCTMQEKHDMFVLVFFSTIWEKRVLCLHISFANDVSRRNRVGIFITYASLLRREVAGISHRYIAT